METIRLNKFISDTGVCSRREADKIIEEGRVTVNGTKATLGTKVGLKDKVELDGTEIGAKEKAIYIAFNKPVGITCTTDPQDKNNIIDFIKHPKRIFPIGRLDNQSEGLIFLTNDGNIVNKILRAGNNHEKEYEVVVNKPISKEFIKRMGIGVPILGTMTKKCLVTKQNTYVFKIVLTQGLNRQIRRMCEALDYRVMKLKRVRIMNVTLDKLKIGEWRNLKKEELDIIFKMISNSIKTEEASIIERNPREL